MKKTMKSCTKVVIVVALRRLLSREEPPWSSKDGSISAGKDLLGSYLRPLMRTMVDTHWERLEHEKFVFASAFIFGDLNHAHPFREGNGRVTRAALHELSKPSKFELDFNQIST